MAKILMFVFIFLSACTVGAFDASIHYTPPSQEVERKEESKIKAIPETQTNENYI